jgi:hypothetical protein
MKIRSGHCVEPGTLIRVKSAAEIAATLDDRGSLDGLPFMPEMLRFCGREFQVAARIEKTCVEGCGVRRFARNDVVTLEGLRCDGSSHDGCAVSCAIFWKEAWIAESPQNHIPACPENAAEQIDSLRTRTSAGTFFCQAAELARATSPISALRLLLLVAKDLASGRVKPLMVARNLGPELFSRVANRQPFLLVKKVKALIARRISSTASAGGETPIVALGLHPGDVVRVKTKMEIEATLDSHGKNRGLAFTSPLFPYCEGSYRVLARLDKVVLETSGKMVHIPNTVILDKVVCRGLACCAPCPREQYLWWREAWLKKAD